MKERNGQLRYLSIVIGAFLSVGVIVGLTNNLYSLYVIPITTGLGISRGLYSMGDHGPLYRVRLLQSVYGPALPALRLPAADGPAGPARRRVLRGLRNGTQCRPAVSRR